VCDRSDPESFPPDVTDCLRRAHFPVLNFVPPNRHNRE
jgi:hypothetical protein